MNQSRLDGIFNSSGRMNNIPSMNSLPSHQATINNFESRINTSFAVSSVFGGIIFVLFLVVFGVVLYKVVIGPRAKAVIITYHDDENSYNKDVKINIDSPQPQRASPQYNQSTGSNQPPSYQEATRN